MPGSIRGERAVEVGEVDASASKLGPPIAADLAAARSAELRDLIDAKKKEYSRRRSGEMSDVVLTGRRRGVLGGITEDYLDVIVDSTELAQRFTAQLEWVEGKLIGRAVEEAVA